MAKVQIKSEKLTPFGGLFSIMEQFDSMLSPIIDQTLGQRGRSIIGYQYSEIVRSLMSVYFCRDSCVEDVTSHLMRHLSYHPMLRTCSSDTILRTIRELTQDNISYTSNQGKTYDFNTADKLNALLIRAEYLHRKPGLCKTFQNWIRVRHSLWLESAYCFKSHCGVRGMEYRIRQHARFNYHD